MHTMSPSPTLYREPYRPQYHYSPPRGWMNDPNGLVYYEGEYHLFYQHDPHSTHWGPMHWGHAVSPDLVHWQTLPIALYPDEHGAIWSGCVVVDVDNTSGLVQGGGLVAVYSYDTQAQGVAYSTDCGRTWTKYSRNPVLPAQARDFRDPKVFWHAGTDRWVMILSAGTEIRFYTAPNLLHWEHVGTFRDDRQAGVWECPDLRPIQLDEQTYWVLISGVNSGVVIQPDGQAEWVLVDGADPGTPSGGSGTRYFIGQFDGQNFTSLYPEETLWLDHGPDNYAAVTFANAPEGRSILIGWMNNWQYATRIPTDPWRGVMTVPRQLSLAHTPLGIRLVQQPVPELQQLRRLIDTWQDIQLEGHWIPDRVAGRSLEILAVLELGTAQALGFEVHLGQNDSARICYTVDPGRVSIDRSGAGVPEFFRAIDGPLIPNNGRIALHIMVDESSVEVFADDGKLVLTGQIFCASKGDGLALFAVHGTARLVSMTIYELESAWQ